jgi:methyl-accepting chemotaxis protein
MKSIRNRLMIQAMLITLISVTAISAISLVSMYRDNQQLNRERYLGLNSQKHDRLINLVDRMARDAQALAKSRVTVDSYLKLYNYHVENSVGADDEYPIKPEYLAIQQEIHEAYRDYIEIYGYRNLYFICKAHGHLMFSAENRGCLGHNLRTGPLKDSVLAHAWKKVCDSGRVEFEDFEALESDDGRQTMFMGAPVTIDGVFVGVVLLALDNRELNTVTQSRVGMSGSAESYVVGLDDKGKSRLRSDRQIKQAENGTEKSDEIIDRCLRQGEEGLAVKTGSSGEQELVVYHRIETDYDVQWGLFTTVAMTEINNAAKTTLVKIIWVVLAVLTLVTASFYLSSTMLTRRLEKTSLVMADIADGEGDLVSRLGVVTMDEIGRLATSFNRFVGKIHDTVARTKRALSQSQQQNTELLAAITDTTATIGQISSTARTITAGTSAQDRQVSATLDHVTEQLAKVQEVNDILQKLGSEAGGLGEAVDSQSAGTTELAAAIEQISANINHVAQAASRANESMVHLSARSVTSQELMGKTSQVTRQVLTAVEDIRSFSAIIVEVASQTNLLAMNAAIEAAHAGEAGKGFAVVAEEIRKLSDRSGEEAAKANSAINEIISAVEQAVENIRHTESEFTVVREESSQVQEIITGVSQAMDEQSSGTREMLSSVNELREKTDTLNNAFSVINSSITAISAALGELSTRSGQTEESMNTLSELSKDISRGISEINTGMARIATVMEQLSTSANSSAATGNELAAEINRFKTADDEPRLPSPEQALLDT